MRILTLSHAVSWLVTWWLGLAMLFVALWIALRLAGDRRTALQDLLLRWHVVLEVLLVPVSFVATLEPAASSAPSAQPYVADAISAPAAFEPTSPGPILAEDPLRASAGVASEGLASTPASWSAHGFQWRAGARPAYALLGLGVYSAGALIALGRLALDARRLSRLRRSARPCGSIEVSRALAIAARRAGLRAPPEVLDPGEGASPMLCGVWRPWIAFPATLAGLTGGQLEALLAHELSHLHRRDIAWALAHRILTAFSWPLVFQVYVSRRLEAVAELLCDAVAARGEAGPEGYLQGLLAVLRMERSQSLPGMGAAAAVSRSFLRRRIEMLTQGFPVETTVRSAWRWSVATLALVFVVFCAASRVHVSLRAADEESEKLSAEVERARKELASLYLRQAAAAYAAGKVPEGRAILIEAEKTGGMGNQPHALGEGLGVLAVPGWSSSLGYLGRSKDDKYRPFVLECIERRVGPLDPGSPGHWESEDSRLLVHDMNVLRKTAALFASEERGGPMVTFRFRFLRVPRERLPALLRAAGDAQAKGEVRRSLSEAQGAALEDLLKSPGSSVQSEEAPTLTCFNKQVAFTLVANERSYIEKYRLLSNESVTVADPVVGVFSDGVVLESLPEVLDGKRVRLLARATRVKLKEMKSAVLDLGPSATNVPLAIPNLERDVATYDVDLEEGPGVLLGTVPAETAAPPPAAPDTAKIGLPWLWIQATITR